MGLGAKGSGSAEERIDTTSKVSQRWQRDLRIDQILSGPLSILLLKFSVTFTRLLLVGVNACTGSK